MLTVCLLGTATARDSSPADGAAAPVSAATVASGDSRTIASWPDTSATAAAAAAASAETASGPDCCHQPATAAAAVPAEPTATPAAGTR